MLPKHHKQTMHMLSAVLHTVYRQTGHCSINMILKHRIHTTKETMTGDTPAKSVEQITHKKFCEKLVKILEPAKNMSATPVPVEGAMVQADMELAEAIKGLFAESKVEVTPKLLEKRQRLREKYPALFGDIKDSELDS